MPPQIPTFAAMCRLKFRPCEAFVLTSALRNGREQIIIIFITLHSVSACRKNLFLKQTSNLLSLSPCPLSRERGILLGLPPLVPVGGSAPKQGCFGCLPKVLHDAKPAEQATLDTPFFINRRGFSTVCNAVQRFIHLPAFFCSLSLGRQICRMTSFRPSAPAI